MSQAERVKPVERECRNTESDPKIKLHSFIPTPARDANTSQLALWKCQSIAACNPAAKYPPSGEPFGGVDCGQERQPMQETKKRKPIRKKSKEAKKKLAKKKAAPKKASGHQQT